MEHYVNDLGAFHDRCSARLDRLTRNRAIWDADNRYKGFLCYHHSDKTREREMRVYETMYEQYLAKLRASESEATEILERKSRSAAHRRIGHLPAISDP